MTYSTRIEEIKMSLGSRQYASCLLDSLKKDLDRCVTEKVEQLFNDKVNETWNHVIIDCKSRIILGKVPDDGQQVLVTDYDGKVYQVKYMKGFFRRGFKKVNVLAWKSMPEQYRVRV